MADFHSLPKDDRDTILQAYNVINKMEKIGYLKNYEVDPTRGFIWTEDKTIVSIMSNINQASNDMHSGASLAFVMRWLQYLVKNDITIDSLS